MKIKKINRFMLACLTATFALFSLGALNGCKKVDLGLTPFVSELRQNIYEGEKDGLRVKATYGYRESPYLADGKIEKSEYRLTFTLPEILPEDATYTLSFKYNDTDYKTDFKLNVAKNVLYASVPIENFNAQEFSVTVIKATTITTLNLVSTIPQGTLSFRGALDTLQNKQPSLIKEYTDQNGQFCAEIYQRIIVKDGKAYWYIGLTDKSGGIKALLIDGKTGELLAVREVF
ncbi:MAG: hypothetical protein IJZ73_01440 [Clostridia bacterium]|nr:hypothetical protein [Clostridia bacterium]